MADYEDQYVLAEPLRKGGQRRESLRDAARIEVGLRSFLEAGGFNAFTDTFEDLHGLKQLPGIAAQRLMADGYGFGAEGDWKTAILVRLMKVMASGLPGGTSFMEDYTYHFTPNGAKVLGAHMLEVCPTISSAPKPSCEIHPLAIGGKEDPVRLVFTAPAGPGLVAGLLDFGDRFRMVVNVIDVVAPDEAAAAAAGGAGRVAAPAGPQHGGRSVDPGRRPAPHQLQPGADGGAGAGLRRDRRDRVAGHRRRTRACQRSKRSCAGTRSTTTLRTGSDLTLTKIPVDTARSPHARWRTLPLDAVSLSGGFWAARQTVNAERSLSHGYRMLEEAGQSEQSPPGGRVRSRVSTKVRSSRTPTSTSGSKRSATSRRSGSALSLQARADETIELIRSAQAEDGYLDSYYQVVAPESRWTDIPHGHELYCAGHLMQAAVAFQRCAGDGRLLDVVRRLVDHIGTVFGPDKRAGTPGHPEVEMALVELYRETGESRYLDLAKFFVDQRGRGLLGPSPIGGRAYYQDRVPVRETTDLEGHAVRALYLACGRRRRLSRDRRRFTAGGTQPPVAGLRRDQAVPHRRGGLAL